MSWCLSDSVAETELPRFRARFDAAHPESGMCLTESAATGNGHAAHLFGVCWVVKAAAGAVQLADCFLRGNELIAKYNTSGDARLAREIRWTIVGPTQHPAADATIDCILSAQTDQLDDIAAIDVITSWRSAEIWVTSANAAGAPPTGQRTDFRRVEHELEPAGSLGLIRPRGQSFSCALMVHPSDCRSMVASSTVAGDQDETLAKMPVFRERLEKGVIRRARLRAALVRREDDVQRAASLFAEFVQSAPPLTA